MSRHVRSSHERFLKGVLNHDDFDSSWCGSIRVPVNNRFFYFPLTSAGPSPQPVLANGGSHG